MKWHVLNRKAVPIFSPRLPQATLGTAPVIDLQPLQGCGPMIDHTQGSRAARCNPGLCSINRFAVVEGCHPAPRLPHQLYGDPIQNQPQPSQETIDAARFSC